MPTVPIDVQEYKKMYFMLLDVFKALHEDRCLELMNDEIDITKAPFPDWICDHCGFVNDDGDFQGELCPRCGNNPIVQ